MKRAMGLILIVVAGGLGTAAQAAVLGEEVAASLQFMQEEEKLAHDVYARFSERWQLPVFANIQRSEQRHMSALARFAAFGTQESLPQGRFADASLQALFDQLVQGGLDNSVAALKAGALIEEKDIADLDQKIAENPPDALRQTYERLRAASWQHLGAFVRNLAQYGHVYEPRILPTECFKTMQPAARQG